MAKDATRGKKQPTLITELENVKKMFSIKIL